MHYMRNFHFEFLKDIKSISTNLKYCFNTNNLSLFFASKGREQSKFYSHIIEESEKRLEK